MGKKLDAIKVLILANVLLFAAANLLTDLNLDQKLALYYPGNERFRFFQFLTHMFMHGGISHILFNMYGLWAFGTPLELMWGKKRFLIFYFSAGLGAGVIYTLVNYFQFNSIYNELTNAGVSANDIKIFLELDLRVFSQAVSVPASMNSFSQEKLIHFYQLFNTPAVGASGAIYGVLVAFGMSFPNSKLALIFLPIPIAAKYFIPILIAMDLFSGVTGVSIFGGGGIAHFAHIGGAIIGFLLMWIWRKQIEQQGPRVS